jgi:hypothetical protein
LIASHDIPKGSQLIVLPDNIPLKFGDEDGVDEAHSVLVKLAQKVPGMYFFPYSWVSVHILGARSV